MYSKVISGMTLGIEGMLVDVEADISPGLPVLSLVGYLTSSVREAGERVRTAMKNSDFILPASRITVNLSPADIKKDGAVYDLAIALAILVCMQIIPEEKLDNVLILGELSLSGEIKPVEGVLPIVHYASKNDIKAVVLPRGNLCEASLVEGVKIIAAEDLGGLVDFLREGSAEGVTITRGGIVKNSDEAGNSIETASRKNKNIDDHCIMDELNMDYVNYEYDMSSVKGQDSMKRGVMLAVSGFHNILMNGAAGSGKSMIAKCIPGIMPPLSFEESIELTKIYSISGLTKNQNGLIRTRPFRSPHHTVTSTALMGGGLIPKPGEVSLSHRGVLFLDELPEYKKNVIECLRQPMEDKRVTISRLHAVYDFPAEFMLVAASNPCPCGHYPDRRLCHCSEREIRSFRNRISFPIMDRIDIRLEVRPVPYQALNDKSPTLSSSEMRNMILAARERQLHRYRDETIKYNSELQQSLLAKYIHISDAGERLLKNEFETSNLSARGYFRIKKLARTVADLNDREEITEEDVYEAMFYRNTAMEERMDNIC
ncbi:MAG: YifB family Mg chelatase-like AAA ATPase [Eubacterium sp.]|nr:YifB family Mg chelatase-like AAA ATPase [Eubacterium sp.]